MLEQIFTLHMYICGLIGLLLNTILLICIKWASPVELSEMRYFLANMALADILLAITGSSAQINIIFYKNYTILESLGPVRFLGRRAVQFCYCTWGFMSIHSCYSIPFGFYFRQKKVCRLTTGPVLTPRQFLKIIASIGLFSGLLGFGQSAFLVDCDRNFAAQLENFSQSLDCSSIFFIEFGVPNMNDRSGSIASKWKPYSYFLWTLVLHISNGLGYTVVVVYLVKILRFLKTHRSSFNAATYRKLLSFYKVNLGQALLPLTLIVPEALAATSIVLTDEKQEITHFGYLVAAIIALLPVFDPIFPLYFIQRYREAVQRKWSDFRTKIHWPC